MKPKILVVDDETDICRALEFLLTREGYAVSTANSGEDAIVKIEKVSFDVILTDLRMGSVDGMTVIEKAKELSPNTAVIMMTALPP
jgi:DNA-binding NtrC family response regulator